MNQAAEQAQKDFHTHLCRHPAAHTSAKKFLAKVKAGDPRARQMLRGLARRASSDARAANALRILAVTHKFDGGTMFMGAVPAVVHGATKLFRVALAPAGWVLGEGGKAFHWAGRTLQHVAHAI